jgi:hypothetical protein
MGWQLMALAVAIGLIVTPDLVGLSDASARALHILAPIDAAVAAMAASAVLRGLRRLHLLLGPAMAAVPLLLGGEPLDLALTGVGGATLTALAFPGGSDMSGLGGGWRSVWRPPKSTIGPRTGADRQ